MGNGNISGLFTINEVQAKVADFYPFILVKMPISITRKKGEHFMTETWQVQRLEFFSN